MLTNDVVSFEQPGPEVAAHNELPQELPHLVYIVCKFNYILFWNFNA